MAVPRSLRSPLAVAVALVLLSTIYLTHTYNPSSWASLLGHKHPLADKDDLALQFPYDPLPSCNFASLSKYPAHNINEPSKQAFATLYCTRQPDTRDPYFEAAQSLIYRLLWSEYRSKYPVIVFVCPFIPEENRRILKGQGAIVKEIELLDDIIPDDAIFTKRWIDVLSKLNLWKAVEWKRLVFLDSDAFPVMNIDDIFDLVPVQQCKKETLDPKDKAVVRNGNGGEDMCNYVYAGVWQFSPDNINAGMLVFKPNLDMHAKLIRAASSTGDYDIHDMEQGVLKSKNAFAADGPFPVNVLPPIWNVDTDYYKKYIAEGLEATEGPLRILHVKMWNRMWGAVSNLTYLNDMWDLDWMKMCRFFDSDGGFIEARKTGVYRTPWERYEASLESG
jgi:inositol 3-alpha-galactosyltransferase